MADFEKTSENKLRISKEETVVSVQEFSLEEIEENEKKLSEHIAHMEQEIADHKEGLKNLKDLKKKCQELNIEKKKEVAVEAEEVVSLDESIKP
jgi:hypothetical protein